jgi:prepilin-type N-terminal cleavage/methylation domain-containing protein
MFLLKNNKLSDTQPSINKSSKKYFRKIQAFSLIELSIVILIIGILVAGVTSSSRLITRMKVVTAQNLTRNSPVSSIKDLSFWIETSLDESFDNAEESEDSPITNWFDLNPQTSFKVNANQSTVDNKPKFKTAIFNGLPGILFDGTNDFLLTSSSGIVGKGLTIFIVAKRTGFPTWQGMLSGIPTSTVWDHDQTGFLAYLDVNNGYIHTGASNTYWASVAQTNPMDNVPFIFTNVFTGSTNITYLNTSVGVTTNITTNFNVDKLYIGSRYGNGPTQFYRGHVGEIVIYSRALNTEERLAVTAYLSKKYAIKVS